MEKDPNFVQPSAFPPPVPPLNETKSMGGKLSSCLTSADSSSQVHGREQIQMSNYQLFLSQLDTQDVTVPSSLQLVRIGDRSGQEVRNSWEWFNFPVLAHSGRQLCQLATGLICSGGFGRICPPELVQRLVLRVYQGYNLVSFHNFSHGFSLMHMFHLLVRLDRGFGSLFSAEELGYILIAGLGHDLGHPGTNNLFQQKIQSPWCAQAGGQSILEKMHARELFKILDSTPGMFSNCTNPSKTKDMMLRCILSTDISKHFDNMAKAQSLLQNAEGQPPDDQYRYSCLQQVFHACDIGNSCLEYQEYINWAALLSFQFHQQAVAEARIQVPVTAGLEYQSLGHFYRGQIGFITVFVVPLWKQICQQWPSFGFLLGNIETNLEVLRIKADSQAD